MQLHTVTVHKRIVRLLWVLVQLHLLFVQGEVLLKRPDHQCAVAIVLLAKVLVTCVQPLHDLGALHGKLRDGTVQVLEMCVRRAN